MESQALCLCGYVIVSALPSHFNAVVLVNTDGCEPFVRIVIVWFGDLKNFKEKVLM